MYSLSSCKPKQKHNDEETNVCMVKKTSKVCFVLGAIAFLLKGTRRQFRAIFWRELEQDRPQVRPRPINSLMLAALH